MPPAVLLRVGLALGMVSAGALVSAWPELPNAAAGGLAPVAIADAVVEVADPTSTAAGFAVPADAAIKLAARSCGRFMVGTGFVAGPDAIATARHVVEAEAATIGALSAPVTGVDPAGRDAAVVAFATDGLAGAPLATSVPDTGTRVAAVGYPGGGRRVVSYGVVTGIADGARFGQGDHRLLLLSSLVDEGFSGGPVFDERGVIVAMVVSVERNSGGAVALPVADLAALFEGGSPPTACRA